MSLAWKHTWLFIFTLPHVLQLSLNLLSFTARFSTATSERWIYFSLTKLQVTLCICKHSRKVICWPAEWNHCEAVIGPKQSSNSPFTALSPQWSTLWLQTIKKRQIYILTKHTWSVGPHSATEGYLIQTRYAATVYDTETNISLLGGEEIWTWESNCFPVDVLIGKNPASELAYLINFSLISHSHCPIKCCSFCTISPVCLTSVKTWIFTIYSFSFGIDWIEITFPPCKWKTHTHKNTLCNC